MTIDRTVLLSLIPMDRWASADEIAVQLGQTPSTIRSRIADLIAVGASIDTSAAGYQRYDPSIDVWAEPEAQAAVPPKPRPTHRAPGPKVVAVDVPPESFAAAVRRARIAVGLSQNALARLSGVDPAYVNRMEKGNHHPARPVVLAMASALGMDTGATDRFLYLAGHAPETDYQTLYEGAQRRLAGIDRSMVGWTPDATSDRQHSDEMEAAS